MRQYTINKFGGSSLASADCFRKVAQLVNVAPQIVVVSAVGGTTNLLQECLDLAEQDQDYLPCLQTTLTKQYDILQQLELELDFSADQNALQDVLNTVRLTRSYSPQIKDLILSYGETWSAQILNALLNLQGNNAQFLNAEQIIFVQHKAKVVQVDWSKSQYAWDAFLLNAEFSHLVVTGFIASDLQGKRTTLGRNGSDFSAAIIAKLAGEDQLTIWTDVAGVYSADPRRVPKAFVIEHLSYQEILELSYFGAKVLHPAAIAPAIESDISIHIKNTFSPSEAGTTISVDSVANEHLVQGVSSIDDVALLNIAGPGMVGVSGTAARLFKTLSDAHISVILISQASSEHSICIAVRSFDVAQAVELIEQTFYLEIKAGLMNSVRVDENCAVIAAVGDGMVGTPGITARMGQALAQANISIKALAQGSSERNISAVIDRAQINKALRVVHSGFYLSGKTLSIGLIGPGLIGQELLAQLLEAKEQLQQDFAVNLSLRAIMNSKKMLLSEQEHDFSQWMQAFDGVTAGSDFTAFADYLLADDAPHAVIIDCSASEMCAAQYLDFMRRGIHIITPNKKANSGSLDYYLKLMDLTRDGHHHYLYETTVCAGLPVIKTLQDMIQSGDEVHNISGIVSGTLAYIFNEFSSGKPFSQIVLDAKSKGFTEPDPRDDLGGTDVARKMVVLAREVGLDANLDDVAVTNLVPEALRECSVDEFLAKLPEHDAAMRATFNDLLKPGEKACYVGEISTDGSIVVKMAGYPATHPFSNLSGTDNILAFKTKRYAEQALVVQGPGAGAAVTAAGVFADLLRLVSFLD
jgi:aspartokinase/homoserine dehydrogenase 1